MIHVFRSSISHVHGSTDATFHALPFTTRDSLSHVGHKGRRCGDTNGTAHDTGCAQTTNAAYATTSPFAANKLSIQAIQSARPAPAASVLTGPLCCGRSPSSTHVDTNEDVESEHESLQLYSPKRLNMGSRMDSGTQLKDTAPRIHPYVVRLPSRSRTFRCPVSLDRKRLAHHGVSRS